MVDEDIALIARRRRRRGRHGSEIHSTASKRNDTLLGGSGSSRMVLLLGESNRIDGDVQLEDHSELCQDKIDSAFSTF